MWVDVFHGALLGGIAGVLLVFAVRTEKQLGRIIKLLGERRGN